MYPQNASGIVNLYPMYLMMILGKNRQDRTRAPYKTLELITPIPSTMCKLLCSLLRPYNIIQYYTMEYNTMQLDYIYLYNTIQCNPIMAIYTAKATKWFGSSLGTIKNHFGSLILKKFQTTWWLLCSNTIQYY